MQAVEVATIKIKAGSNVFDRGSEAARIWRGMLDTISRQKGCQTLYSGQEHESPNIVQLLVVWDSVQSHKNFMDSPQYQPFLDTLSPLLAGQPQLVHFELKSAADDLAAAVSAPVTELATIFLTEKTQSFYDNVGSFADILRDHTEGFLGISYSWCIEDVEHECLGEGFKGKACILAIGWSSIDAHLAFKQTDAFRRGLEFLRGARGSEIHHTIFQTTG
ncbi:hypothetical protein D6C83_06723 [Aureobasidium pullulans]|uniref:ABM domain-containing protein n=1 Tax=Aureobasidium pullulans TaxID=5580 RepID=A0A4V4LE98_AURPU|nr:hypothetical protein D6C83_06723 [Aureobasidium pullulans]